MSSGDGNVIPHSFEGVSTDSLERLARVARRGLQAASVMIGGSSIGTIMVADTMAKSGLDKELQRLCDGIERDGQNASREYGDGIGIALRRQGGEVIGALCAIDGEGRTWSRDDHALLYDLAALFESEAKFSAEIQRRRAAEEASDLVTRELSHRIKNIFAVVTSLVALSVRSHPKCQDFAQGLSARIAALGIANDYVRPQGQNAAAPATQSLLGLIHALMTPYQERDRTRISIEGEDAPIGTTATTTMALVLHELATNAVKYGGLSSSSGTVSIRCTKSDSVLRLSWQENGGPPLAGPPTQHGFGTVLSQRAMTNQLGASLHNDWRPEGLSLSLEIPLRRLAV